MMNEKYLPFSQSFQPWSKPTSKIVQRREIEVLVLIFQQLVEYIASGVEIVGRAGSI